MSKGLKALKHLGLDFENAFNKYKECNDTRDILKAWDFFFPYFEKDIAIIEKELKALEIIREKQVQVNRLNRSHSYKQYNLYLPKEMHLTQEEYDLLKEVLL